MSFSHMADVNTAEYFMADMYVTLCYVNGLSWYPATNIAFMQCFNLIKN